MRWPASLAVSDCCLKRGIDGFALARPRGSAAALKDLRSVKVDCGRVIALLPCKSCAELPPDEKSSADRRLSGVQIRRFSRAMRRSPARYAILAQVLPIHPRESTIHCRRAE